MSPLNPRSVWVDPKYPVSGPAANLSKVDQIVIHYPGVAPNALPLGQPVQVLRNTHLFYLGKKPVGYSIGYNFATFPSGRWVLRGFDIKNAANANHNDHTLSINVMVNGADEAPPAQVQFTRDMVADIWDRLGRKVPLIAHGELLGANTACPGAGIRRQLDANLFLPVPEPPVEDPPMKLYKKAGKDAVWLADKITRQHVPNVTALGILEGKYGPLKDLDPKYDLEQLGQQVLSYTADV